MDGTFGGNFTSKGKALTQNRGLRGIGRNDIHHGISLRLSLRERIGGIW